MSARANNIVSSSTESINTRIWYTKYVLTMLLSTNKLESVIWSLGARYLTSIQVPPKCTDSSQNFFPTQSRMYLQAVFDRKLLAALNQKLSLLKNLQFWDFLHGLVLEVSINISLAQVVRFGSKLFSHSISDVSSSCFWPKIASGPESKVVSFEKLL